MTDEREEKLVLAAEAALGTATLREPDWDALAARIDGALGAAGTTDDALLLPPLPESIEDGQEPVAAVAAVAVPATRETTSLADLARAAVARRGKKEAVDLAKESLVIASQGRGTEPAAAAPTIVVDREDSTFPSARKQRAVERASVERAMDTRGPWIGVAIAAVGLAAGFGLYLTSKRTQIVEVPVAQTAAPVVTNTPAAPAAIATPEPQPEPAKVAGDAPVDARPAEADEKPAPAEPAGAVALAEKSSAKASAPGSPARAAATPAGARPEKVVLDEEHAASGTSTGAAAKPADSGLRPAELNTNGGGMSDRPSTGAAQAAVGAVLGAARACIAGQPEASSATLTFGSSGEVTSVSVGGAAEGTPAATCIKGALGKARVQPFAAKSFSLGVTIRPL